MKRYILILLLAFTTTTVFAAPEADFRKIIKEYTFRNDGEVEITYYKELKINTQIAFNRLYGETFVIYNPVFQKLKIDTSYTIQSDGTAIITPPNAFNEVLPADAANAPAYNHLKEMVITHTGLETGATIFLKYTLHSKPDYYNEIDIDDILQETSPVKEYVVIINVPARQTLNYILTGYNASPAISEKNGIKQYRWTLKNIPAASREPYLPQALNNVPRLTATSYSSQAGPLEALKESFSSPLNEIGEFFTRELVKSDKTIKGKMMTIQKYVADQVANCPVPPENTGYKMRSPYEILRSSYGTEAEKTLLLFNMLKVINTDPELVVVYPGTMKKAVKGLKPISGLKVKVNDNDGTPLFLSATTYPSGTPELRGERDESWLVSEQGIRLLSVIGSLGEISYKANIKIDTLRAITSATMRLSGGLVPVMELKETETYLKKLTGPAGKTIISQINSTETHNARLYFSAEQRLNPQHSYIIYKLPGINEGLNTWNINMLNTSRENIFEIPYPVKEVYEYELKLAPGIKIKTNDCNVEISRSIGSVRISIKQNGDIVKIYRELKLNKSLITPSEYPDFRKIVNTWMNPNTNQLILFSGK